MKRLDLIVAISLMMAMSICADAVTTGDLIAMDKESPDWPPLILDRPMLQYIYDTENFCIHYDTQGVNAVYHPDEDINPADGVPDYVNRVAEYFESAHYVYLTELGFDRPPPDEGFGGDDRYDVYITRITGLTVPEFRSDYYPDRYAYASYIYIGNDMRNEHHPNDPYPFLMATCAHEYFHAVQMAYRAYAADETYWWYELTAMWAEERVFDELNELYYSLEDYYCKIHCSIYLTGGSHMYGAWVYAEFLSQNYGNDMIRRIFEKLIYFENSLAAIISTLNEYNLDFNTEFSLFACWNYFTGENVKTGFFEEGGDFPVTVPVSAYHYYYPLDWRQNEQGIENLGIAYIYFGNPGIPKGDLVIIFKSDYRYSEGLCAAGIYNDRDVELSTYKVDAAGTIEVRVEDFNDCEAAVLSIIWEYENITVYDTANYRYCAYIDTSTVEIASWNVDKPDSFQLIGNYPNPFNLSTQISFYWNLEPIPYSIRFYDIAGKEMASIEGLAVTGLNSVNWEAKDNLATGIYFYKLVLGEKSAGGKMLLLK